MKNNGHESIIFISLKTKQNTLINHRLENFISKERNVDEWIEFPIPEVSKSRIKE